MLDFKLLEDDLTANLKGTSRLDMNGETAALIKINTLEKGFTFTGDMLGLAGTEEKTNAIWVYVPRRAQRLTIRHPRFGSCTYEYPVSIKGASTYEMYLGFGIGRYVTLTTTPDKAHIYIDEKDMGESPLINYYLTFGEHKVQAEKGRYEATQVINIEEGDERQFLRVNVPLQDMSNHYGDITVTVKGDENADIYFRDVKMGTGTWRDQLKEGTYTIETRKQDCDPVQTTFTVLAREDNQIEANAPTPHTGWLQLYTRPRDLTAIADGVNPIDATSPISLPVGMHQVQFTRKTYRDEMREYNIEWNKITRDTVDLLSVNYVKRNGIYFGGAYHYRTLSGVSAVGGITVVNFDLEFSYTFGMTSTANVNWYSDNQPNSDYLSTMTYKMNSIGVRLGYQWIPMRRLAIVPQLGFSCDRLSGTIVNGNTAYADNATANCATIGVKLLLVPFQHLYMFATPELDIAVKKDNNFTKIAEAANFSAGGFVVRAGLLVNF